MKCRALTLKHWKKNGKCGPLTAKIMKQLSLNKLENGKRRFVVRSGEVNKGGHFMEPDIIAFKKGLAGIMIKHQLACFRGLRDSFIGYCGDKNSTFYIYCGLRRSLPPKPFNELFDQPTYDLQSIVSDLKDLFDYYKVRQISNQYLETFFIGPDDNNQFVMEHVNLEFFTQEEKVKKDENSN